jgi:hypothetical protein
MSGMGFETVLDYRYSVRRWFSTAGRRVQFLVTVVEQVPLEQHIITFTVFTLGVSLATVYEMDGRC